MPKIRTKKPPDGSGESRSAIDQDDAMEDLVQGLVAVEAQAAAGQCASTLVDTGPRAAAVVKMKLGRAVPDNERFRSLLCEVAKDGNELLAEAYLFANFHVVRLLKGGVAELPRMDRNFYYRCILAVSDAARRASTLDASFLASVAAFDALRPESDQRKVRSWGCHLNATLSIQMSTMATNSLWSNLEKRVESYVRWKHPGLKGFWRPIARYVAWANPSEEHVRTKSKNRLQQDKATQALQVAHELRSAIEGVPDGKWNKPTHAHLVLPLYYQMTVEAETAAASAAEQQRKFPGKVYALLPTKRNFTASFIQVSDWLFRELLKHAKIVEIKGDVRQLDTRPYWRKLFNLNPFETRNRRFDRSITTDGCAVGFLLDKPAAVVAHPQLACGSSSDTAVNPVPLAVGPSTRVVGIDPGFTDVVTIAVRGESLDTTTYSSKRYYEKAKINLSRRRTSVWNAETKAIVDAFPPMRSTEIEAYASCYLSNVRRLLEHRRNKGYRNMRFLRYVHRQKAIEEICDMIAPKHVETMVGFGNWNAAGGSPISRRTCGPLEAIKLELNKRPNVKAFVAVDEFRTSVTCHCCRGRLANMTGMTTRVRQIDGEERRTVFRGKVHKVLHCKTSGSNPTGCGASWNRDTNGSLNILEIAMCYLTGKRRPNAFCRSSTTVRSSNPKQNQGPPVLGVSG